MQKQQAYLAQLHGIKNFVSASTRENRGDKNMMKRKTEAIRFDPLPPAGLKNTVYNLFPFDFRRESLNNIKKK